MNNFYGYKHYFIINIYASSAPSKARLSQLGESPISVSPGKARIPSVALASVTPSVKRTQGGDGPQYVSVKGLSPVINKTVDADAFGSAEGNTRGAHSHGSRGSTGVRDRGTSLWQSRELGRSHRLLALTG